MIIKRIRLKNWRQYRGDYSLDQNTVLFSEGTNIFNANNNYGKSKLFEAIKWVLMDKVFISNGEERKSVKLNSNNYLSVINNNYYHLLNEGDEFSFGVEIEIYDDSIRGAVLEKDKQRFLLKEVKGKKGSHQLTFVSEVKKWGRGNALSKTAETIENKIIPNNLQPFLFLETEMSNEWIPQSGEKLKHAINNITQINNIDRFIEKSESIELQIDKKINAESKNQKNENREAKENASRLAAKRLRHKELVDDIDEIDKQLEPIQKARKEIENQINQAMASLKLLNRKNELKNAKEKAEANLDFEIQRYFNELIGGSFKISSFLPQNESFNTEIDNLFDDLYKFRQDEFAEEIKTSSLSTEDRRILHKLVKGQPGVDILNQIAEAKKCYICKNEHVTDVGIDWIKNILIPHYQNSLTEVKEDPTLISITAIRQIFNQARSSLFSNSHINVEFDEIRQNISSLTRLKKEAKDKYENFVQNNGLEIADDYDPNIIIERDDDLKREEKELEKKKISFGVELKDVKESIKKLAKKNQSPQDGDSESVVALREMLSFQSKITSELIELKKKVYFDFKRDFENKCSRVFRDLFAGDNFNANGSTFELVIGEEYGKVNFRILVKDINGNVSTDPGGAETSMREFSVVITLMSLASEISSKFPLIIDAPLSNVAEHYVVPFYESIIRSRFNDQVILLSKDLITTIEDDEGVKKDCLNNKGLELKRNITPDSKLNLILRKANYNSNNPNELFTNEKL